MIIFPCHDLNQNSSTSDLSFSQVASVEKNKSQKHFSASASKMWPWLQKTFPQFPFFYFGNFRQTKIRRGHIFPQSSQHNYQNKILRISRQFFWNRFRDLTKKKKASYWLMYCKSWVGKIKKWIKEAGENTKKIQLISLQYWQK